MDTVCTNKPLYLGVEIGGTKQQICLGTGDGTISDTREVRLGDVTATEILDWIRTTVLDYMDRYPIAGIGVGFGGPLELKTGRVLCSIQVPGWENFKLTEWFEENFHVPVLVANDTFTGGMAELYAGAGKGSRLMYYTNIGTGIGGGIYFGGKGYDGIGFGAGYLGTTYVPDWRSTEPGAMTHMELLVSGKSIAQRLSTPGYVPADSKLMALATYDEAGKLHLSAKELAEAVKAGDTFATEELDRISLSFSTALANMLALSGIKDVVIGGGVANMGDILFDRIRRDTQCLAFVANKGAINIRPSALLDTAVPVGALILAAGGRKLLIEDI
ncbi:MAG: ROK family protein [Lachnospiraceae bacterium]|nr:ROK family protein [Lachnospiraceae bacterium]